MKNCADIILEETYLPASSCMESSKKSQIENWGGAAGEKQNFISAMCKQKVAHSCFMVPIFPPNWWNWSLILMELLMDMDGWEASSLQEKFQGGVLEIWNFSFKYCMVKM